MSPQPMLLLVRNADGTLEDTNGNKYNAQFQMIDAVENITPVQTLADLTCPYRFYSRRAALQEEIDRLTDESTEQNYEFQSRDRRGVYNGCDDAPFEVQEAPVQQLSHYEMLQRILEDQRRTRDELNSEKRPWEINQTAMGVTEENEVENQSADSTSIDADLCVDRREEEISKPDEYLTKAEDWTSSEFTSIDAALCVDRHDPMQHQTDILTSSSAAEPQPEPPEHVPEPLLDPKPSEQYKIEVVEVFDHGDSYELTVKSEEAATPGSCHKRKSPDTTPQPPLKRIRGQPGAIVAIPNAVYIIDPGDTYFVYSKGPRPPPLKQGYVLSKPFSSAGRHSHPPRRSHPVAVTPAYLIDPEETYAVYHRGPRPP